MKNFKIAEDEFITLMSYHLRLKNNALGALKNALKENSWNQELIDFYIKEIDEMNSFADKLNAKVNTNQ